MNGKVEDGLWRVRALRSEVKAALAAICAEPMEGRYLRRRKAFSIA